MAEVTATSFVEHDDLWELPLVRGVVTRCIYDYAFTLVVGEMARYFEVRIENAFVIRNTAGTSTTLDPASEPERMAESLGLLRKSVTRAIAYKDGRMEIDFEGGCRLSVQPDGVHEPWHITGPAGIRMMANTDGELLVWS